MRCEQLREVYEHFRQGKKEQMGTKKLTRVGKTIEAEVRAVELCRRRGDGGEEVCFITFMKEPDSDNVDLQVHLKRFYSFSSNEKPETCFSLSLPCGLISTGGNYTLGSAAFAAVAVVTQKIAELAHPEIFKQLNSGI